MQKESSPSPDPHESYVEPGNNSGLCVIVCEDRSAIGKLGTQESQWCSSIPSPKA